MAEGTLQITHKDLQAMMESLVAKMKEPTEKEKAQAEKERAELLKRELEGRKLTESQIENERRRRESCPHFRTLNGQRKHGWVGQVNSDNLVRPVCKMCNSEWPPFSANLLPDSGRQGVNFEQWNYCDGELLNKLHKQTYPEGCGVGRCFICSKAKTA